MSQSNDYKMELKDATNVGVHLYNQDIQVYYWSYSLRVVE